MFSTKWREQGEGRSIQCQEGPPPTYPHPCLKKMWLETSECLFELGPHLETKGGGVRDSCFFLKRVKKNSGPSAKTRMKSGRGYDFQKYKTNRALGWLKKKTKILEFL